MRKIFSVLAGAAMLLSFTSSAFASTASVTQNVNFRPIPSTNSYVYTLLKVGTSLDVLEHVNAYWLKISLNGKVGYVSTHFVKETKIPAPTLSADVSLPTNHKVIITIKYPNNATMKQFRINGGDWTRYTAPIIMTANGLVEARGADPAGNVSTIGSYTIRNIDKRSIGEKIVDTAKSFQGKVIYKFGVRDIPNLILDCSSFTQYVFKLNGTYIPWSSKEQGKTGEFVSKDHLQPGDLVFFSVSDPTQINHVGIYIGNDQFINNLPNKGVVISNFSSVHWTTHYLTARRIAN